MPKPVLRGAAIAALLLAALAAFAWWQQQPAEDPGYLANGRLEAVEVHLASRLPGRLGRVVVDEGDHVAAGDPVAQLESEPLEADLTRVRADIHQARQQLELANARRGEAQSECEFARSQLKRLESLSRDNYVSEDQLDAARTRVRTSTATCRAAAAQVGSAEAGIAVANANLQRIQVDLDDLQLTAPISGRVQYRLVEPGEVIPAGGRVVTLISDRDVYLTVFLPTAIAGQLHIGGEQTIRLDAFPQRLIPARVEFVSPQAQFTPKTVETQEERAKLMFRVKLRIDPEYLAEHGDWLKAGMPGTVRFQPVAES